MRRILLSVIVAGLFAVSAQAQFRFGARAGLNTVSSAGEVMKYVVDNSIIGFYIGPSAEYLFNGKFGVDASVLYTEKGIRFAGQSTQRLGYIEVPVNAKYLFPLGDAVHLFGAVGPYISMKVKGKDDYHVTIDDTTGTWNARDFSAGMNFTVGAEIFNLLQLGFTYGLGMSDSFQDSVNEYSLQERVWSFSATAYF